LPGEDREGNMLGNGMSVVMRETGEASTVDSSPSIAAIGLIMESEPVEVSLK
jgi:hypothetical protein